MKCFGWINLFVIIRYGKTWVFNRQRFGREFLNRYVPRHSNQDVRYIINTFNQHGGSMHIHPRIKITVGVSTSRADDDPNITIKEFKKPSTINKCITLLKQLEMPVKSLPGVGPKTEFALHRLGLYTIRSLLFHFPISFIDRSSISKDVKTVPDGDICTVVVTVEFISHYAHSIQAKCRDDSGNHLFIRFHHGPSPRGKQFAVAISKLLGNVPCRRIISGKIRWKYKDNHDSDDNTVVKDHFEMLHHGNGTIAEIINPQVVKKVIDMKAVQKIEPVYRLTEGITQTKMKQTIQHAIQIGSALLRELPEFLPEELLSELSWPTLADSLILAHTPPTAVSYQNGRASVTVSPARLRLVFQEFITQQVFLDITRWRKKNVFHFSMPNGTLTSMQILFQQIYANYEESPLIKIAILSLHFSLTHSQKRCLGELWKDAVGYTGPIRRMTRLLQGDVGAGKTVIAFLLALCCLEHPQLSNVVAFLSPTTLLAQQHVDTLKKFVDSLDKHRIYLDKGPSVRRIHIEYLSGAITGIKRRQVLDRITNCQKDEAVIVVGTHALISEDVTNIFARISSGTYDVKSNGLGTIPGLALCIIDEEQRLGVEQREALVKFAVHTLHMTATPIPRTLALSKILKGGSSVGALDVSTLDEKPASAKNVTTSIVDINNLDRLLKGVQRQVALGAKVFWIVPVIGDEEDDDAVDGQIHIENSMTVTKRFQKLSEYFGPNKVGMIHGRMGLDERTHQLELFSDTKSDMSIIVGTTVLEVGIDIPNVSILIVEEADRFGLSQLHQLRGRIGRATSLYQVTDHKNLDCHCVLLTDVFSSENGKEVAKRRLDILRKSMDGNAIAEVDLMLRGPGEKTKKRQSGLNGGGWTIDLRHHLDLELPASIYSRLLMRRDEFVEQSNHFNFHDTSYEIKLSNEFRILTSFIGRRKPLDNSPIMSVLLRVHLCFFGNWDQAEWGTLRALETLRLMVGDYSCDNKLDMIFIDMAKGMMGTERTQLTSQHMTSASLHPLAQLPVNSTSTIANPTLERLPVYTSSTIAKTVQRKVSDFAFSYFSQLSNLIAFQFEFRSPKINTKPTFSGNDVVFIILDIETTGLSPKSDYIIQIAAKVLGTEKTFCKYVQPPKKLPKNIELITGITDDFLRRGGVDQLTGYDYNIAAATFLDVYHDFCSFCREILLTEGKPLVMVAHNCAFDLRMINSEIQRINTTAKRTDKVTRFISLSRDTGIVTAVDSLALFRDKQIWKGASPTSTKLVEAVSIPESFSLETIYQHLFGMGIVHGHNALADVIALEKILCSPIFSDKWKPLAEKIQQLLVLT